MKINENGWMVRLQHSMYDYNNTSERPKSLCSFFWVMLFTIFFSILAWPMLVFNWMRREVVVAAAIGLITGLIGFAGVVLLLSLGGLPLKGRFDLLLPIFWIGEIVAGLLGWGVLSVIGKICEYKERPDESPGFFSMCGQFIKAKKQKVCPLIEYYDAKLERKEK